MVLGQLWPWTTSFFQNGRTDGVMGTDAHRSPPPITPSLHRPMHGTLDKEPPSGVPAVITIPYVHAGSRDVTDFRIYEGTQHCDHIAWLRNMVRVHLDDKIIVVVPVFF